MDRRGREKVYDVTGRNYDKLLDSPAAFNYSQANFCIQYLVTVLQRQCGVHYNPKWKTLDPRHETPREFAWDANNLFIHAVISGIGGTCGSLPVLYCAVGRRLGYPLKIVKARQHLFVRWDGAGNRHWTPPERINFEATGPGIHFLPDSHYMTWPRNLLDEDIRNGIFLKSLTAREELAEFIAARGYCLQENERMADAVECFGWAAQLAPHNRYFAETHRNLSIRLQLLRRGHRYLNAPSPSIELLPPKRSFSITGPTGQPCIVQISSSGDQHNPRCFTFPVRLLWHVFVHPAASLSMSRCRSTTPIIRGSRTGCVCPETVAMR